MAGRMLTATLTANSHQSPAHLPEQFVAFGVRRDEGCAFLALDVMHARDMEAIEPVAQRARRGKAALASAPEPPVGGVPRQPGQLRIERLSIAQSPASASRCSMSDTRSKPATLRTSTARIIWASLHPWAMVPPARGRPTRMRFAASTSNSHTGPPRTVLPCPPAPLRA